MIKYNFSRLSNPHFKHIIRPVLRRRFVNPVKQPGTTKLRSHHLNYCVEIAK